jgi:hypothetical protein
MILYIVVAVVVIGLSALAGVLATAKATESFNKMTEGDEIWLL